MHPFAYHAALDAADAVQRLAAPATMPLGGGTDLLVQIREGLAAPETLVDLRRLPGASEIALDEAGGARLGAGVRLAAIASHPALRARWPMLGEACASVGTEALRAMGTLGGNLCQRPRCWYFRRGVPCLKNGGGDDCPARDGEHQYHAIIEGGPCWIVHPSDPAVALVALDALVEIHGAQGVREVAAADFFVPPRVRLDGETVLGAGEFVAGVRLPAESAGGWQRYYKAMQRGAWDFALVSLAAAKRTDGAVRLVLGGVAPVPWRVYGSIEEDAGAGSLEEHDVGTLADRALYDAEPLARNGYKVEIAASMLRRAIREIAAA